MTQPATESQVSGTPSEQEVREKTEKSAKDRIEELSRRNKELERLVNMDKRLGNVEAAVTNVAANVNRPPARQKTKEEEEWDPFMRPKVSPIIEEALQPYKAALFGLADQNDKLHTMIAYPEYKDPEIQEEVESIRAERQRQNGQMESRENVILWLRGRNPEKFAPKGADNKGKEDVDEGRSQAVHVEKRSGVGASRAANPTSTKTAEDATVEEMEKWFGDNPGFKI